jgi:ABC-type transport system substrate-binding protein
LSVQYTEFDLEEANNRLDRAGYSKRDAQGFRTLPDGSRISVEILIPIGLSDAWLPALQMVSRNWSEVGIDARAVPLERSLWSARIEASLFDATIWVGTECTDEAIYRPAYYLPFKPTIDGAWSAYAIKWNEWYTSGGIEGEEPPAAVREQFRLYGKVQTSVSEVERRRAFQRIVDIAADQFCVIGVLRPADGFGIVSLKFRNTPAATVSSGFNPDGPGPSRPEQYYTVE